MAQSQNINLNYGDYIFNILDKNVEFPKNLFIAQSGPNVESF